MLGMIHEKKSYENFVGNDLQENFRENRSAGK